MGRGLKPKISFSVLIGFLLVIALISGCSDRKEAQPAQGKAGKMGFSDSPGTLEPLVPPPALDGSGKKLLAIYMVGSDLESGGENGTNDFKELIEGFNNHLSETEKAKIDVIIAFGGAKKQGWEGMKFANMAQLMEDSGDGIFGNSANYLYKAPSAHMGDESSLKFFLEYVRDGYKNYSRRMLVLWNHGATYEGFGNDENYNFAPLSLQAIENALGESGAGKFDIIGFDACLMASMEVAKIVKNYASYMIASEELEPGHGWNWSSVIEQYVKNDEITDTAAAMVDSFVNDASHPYKSDGKTLSVLNMANYDAVVLSLNGVSSVFAENLGKVPEYSESATKASSGAREFGISERNNQRYSVDLKHFVAIARENITSAESRQRLDSLISAVDSFVVYSKHDGSRPNSNGVSIIAFEKSSGENEPLQVSAEWISLARSYNDYRLSDKTAPAVSDVVFEASSSNYMWKPSLNGLLRKGSSLPPFLEGERAAFVYTGSALKSAQAGAVAGTSAVFTDQNLISVTTIFGIEEKAGADEYLITIAEVEAFPTATEGEYFTPKWNQKWYTVAYDPQKDTEWMPMIFEERFQDDGKTFTRYSAEIDFIEAGRDYSGRDYPADFGRLTIIVDDANTVVDYSIQTYKILYDSADDNTGTVQFDRATKKIEPGDGVQFFTYVYHLTDPEKDEWVPTSEIITFMQAPDFGLEVLEFVDEEGNVLSYKFSMKATDINGNIALVEPAPAGVN